MSYAIKLWDKTEIIVDDNTAEKVKASLLSDTQMIGINGNIYAKSAIAQITKTNAPTYTDRELPAGKPIDYRGTISTDRWAEAKRNFLNRMK